MKLLLRALTFTAAMVMAGTSPGKADEVTVAHDRPPYVDALAAVAALKGVKLDQATYGDVDAYKTYVQQSIQTGNMPDVIVWWSGKTFEDVVDTNAFANMDHVWAEMISSGRFPEGLKATFEVDGTAYALPFGVVDWVVWYNQALFAQAGITAPPRTWAELERAVAKLKDAGVTPFVATVEGGWRPFIWFEEIYTKTDPEGFKGLFSGENTYDSDRTRAVFQKWSELYANGWFTDPRSNQEDVDFAGAKGAMMMGIESRLLRLTRAGFDAENLGVFLLPMINEEEAPNVIVEPTALLFSRTGIQRPEVRDFIDAWLSKDGGNLWAQSSGFVTGAVDLDLPSKFYEASYAQKAETRPYNILRWWESTPASLQLELTAELSAFMVDPTMETAEKVMSNMAALVKADGQ